MNGNGDTSYEREAVLHESRNKSTVESRRTGQRYLNVDGGMEITVNGQKERRVN